MFRVKYCIFVGKLLWQLVSLYADALGVPLRSSVAHKPTPAVCTSPEETQHDIKQRHDGMHVPCMAERFDRIRYTVTERKNCAIIKMFCSDFSAGMHLSGKCILDRPLCTAFG